MKLGISMNFPHSSPEEWAQKHLFAGLQAVVFPCEYTESVAVIDKYVKAAAVAGLIIAEVGSWSNPNSPDRNISAQAIQYCKGQLELAEYIGAHCCVNITGGFGPEWDGGYAENYSDRAYSRIVQTTQDIIDAVKPKRTRYSLEPMSHMLPDSPESYLQLIKDIDREGLGVHMDIVNMICSPQLYFDNEAFIDRCFNLLGDKIVSCHLKDCILTQKLPVSILETECGQGGLNIAHYLKTIDEYNFDLPVIIEHLSSEEQYLKAVDYVKSVCYTLNASKGK